MAKDCNLHIEPVIHDTRNEPTSISFTDSHIMIDLSDGRIIGVPLHFFPLLEAATESERQNYQLGSLEIYWEDIDDGMDLTALISGLYIEPSEAYLESLKDIIAERYAAAT